VGSAANQGELCARHPDQIAGNASAEQPEHLDDVFGANDVGIAVDQQGRDLKACEALPRPGCAGTIELVHLDDERCPGVGIGRDPTVRVVPPRCVELVRVERFEGGVELGVHPARIEGRAVCEHEVVDQLGAIEGQPRRRDPRRRPRRPRKDRRIVTVGELSREYGFTDLDGTQPEPGGLQQRLATSPEIGP
jgi:hypothetical protein